MQVCRSLRRNLWVKGFYAPDEFCADNFRRKGVQRLPGCFIDFVAKRMRELLAYNFPVCLNGVHYFF